LKNINYNYAWVFYDVSEKRVNKSHFQKSVFRGDITPSKLISLRSELKSIIVENEDFVCILKSISPDVFGEETLGNPTPNGENVFL